MAATRFCFKRTVSDGLWSRVWKRSEKRRISSTVPALFAQASAFKIFIPQDEIVPATFAKRNGRSMVKNKLVVIVAPGNADFRRRVPQAFVHPVVCRDFRRRMREQISFREAIQKIPESLGFTRLF